MTDNPRRERAVRAAYKVEHDLYGAENRTLAEIRDELEHARKHAIATLATAQKDWQIAQAQALLKEIEREMGAWAKAASSATTGRLGEVADLGVEQVVASLRSGGGLGFSIGAGPMIGRDFVAVAYQTLPDLITNVSADLVKQVGSVLRQAVLAQETPLDAMHRIGTLAGKGAFASAFERGEAIVRTEYGRIAQTANYAALSELARDNAGLRKEWSAVVDGRTRPSHARASGQVRDVEKPFDVGGWPALYPHDPRLPASESVGCRCISVATSADWA
ncbi:MAG: phage minor head protein [Candidatus Limnocylindrales bacterium]